MMKEVEEVLTKRLDYSNHSDTIRAAMVWEILLDPGMKWLYKPCKVTGEYLRYVWDGNYMQQGNPILVHPLLMPWREEVLDALPPYMPFFMDNAECEFYDGLPETFTVYRGGDEEGCCWTLDRETAEKFSRMAGRPELVHERAIDKWEADAYLNGRNEQEIIILDR